MGKGIEVVSAMGYDGGVIVINMYMVLGMTIIYYYSYGRFYYYYHYILFIVIIIYVIS